MPSDCVYLGAAEIRLDTGTIVIGGTIEVGDIFKVTIGTAVVQVSAATTVAASVATQLQAALASTTTAPAQFQEITWSVLSATITWVGPADGRPVSQAIAVATTESNGGAADSQTITKTTTLAGTGPYSYTNTANWSASTLPVTGDNIHLGLFGACPKYDVDGQDAVQPANVYVYSGTFSGLSVGLPKYNSESGYAEYLPTHLECIPDAVYVGSGDGSNVPKLHINTLTAATNFYVLKTDSRGADGVAPISWIGATASSLLDCNGAIDLAAHAGEVSVTTVINTRGDADVHVGVLATTVTITHGGGSMVYGATDAPTTVTVRDGAAMVMSGSGGTITTFTAEKGAEVDYRRVGTITSLIVAGSFDMTNDDRTGKTFTNVDLFSGVEFLDSHKVGTYTNGIDLNHCSLTDKDVTVDVGAHVRITPGAVA